MWAFCFIGLVWRHLGFCFMGLDWRHVLRIRQMSRWTCMFSCAIPTITSFIPTFIPTSGTIVPRRRMFSCVIHTIATFIPTFIPTSGTIIPRRRIAVIVARTGLRHSLYVGTRFMFWNALAGRKRPWVRVSRWWCFVNC